MPSKFPFCFVLAFLLKEHNENIQYDMFILSRRIHVSPLHLVFNKIVLIYLLNLGQRSFLVQTYLSPQKSKTNTDLIPTESNLSTKN